MSKESKCFSSQISYIHYPRGQTDSGKVRSPTSVRRQLALGEKILMPRLQNLQVRQSPHNQLQHSVSAGDVI
jgi:hypothetical protein